MLKYGVRHYAHHVCALRENGATFESGMAFIESLHTHQIRSFPVFKFAEWLKSRGRLGATAPDVLQKAIAKAKEREGATA